jgi:hypothetical protein
MSVSGEGFTARIKRYCSIDGAIKLQCRRVKFVKISQQVCMGFYFLSETLVSACVAFAPARDEIAGGPGRGAPTGALLDTRVNNRRI